MPICKTPGCGVPGRPFPACSICAGRLYCGSHCLRDVSLQHPGDIIVNSHDDSILLRHEKVSLSERNQICPTCFEVLGKYLEVETVDERGDPTSYLIKDSAESVDS